MNKVIKACLQEFENTYERSEELNYFSKKYNNLINNLDKDTAKELSEVLSEIQIIQQSEFFEAGFKYGSSLNE